MIVQRAAIAITLTTLAMATTTFAVNSALAAAKPSVTTKPGKVAAPGAARTPKTLKTPKAPPATKAAKVPNPGWSPVMNVAPAALIDLRVVIDAEGTSTAVWSGGDAPGRLSVFSSRKAQQGPWSPPTEIDGNPTETSFEPQIGVDAASGRVMAIWLTEKGLWGRMSESNGWGAGAQIDKRPTTQGGVIRNHRVGVDSSGNAIAVWDKNDALGQFSIWSSRFSAGGWSPAASIETNDLVAMLDAKPVLAVAPNGTALAVWHSSASKTNESTPRRGLWSNRYSPATGWGRAAEVVNQEPNTLLSDGHDLAVDAQGNAILVWSQINTDAATSQQKTGIYSKRSTDGGWQSLSEVTAQVPIARPIISYPRVSMSPAGHAVVGWTIDEDNSLRASVASPGGVWSAPMMVKAPSPTIRLTSLGAGLFAVAIDDSGSGFVQWNQNAPREDAKVWIRRFEAGSQWGGATLQQTDAAAVGQSALAMNGRGSGVSWYYQGGIIKARSFSPQR